MKSILKKKLKKQVITSTCENCLTKREADPVCFERGFLWGNGKIEPKWIYSYENAEKRIIKRNTPRKKLNKIKDLADYFYSSNSSRNNSIASKSL